MGNRHENYWKEETIRLRLALKTIKRQLRRLTKELPEWKKYQEGTNYAELRHDIINLKLQIGRLSENISFVKAPLPSQTSPIKYKLEKEDIITELKDVINAYENQRK